MSAIVRRSPPFAANGTLGMRAFAKISQATSSIIVTWRSRARQRSELLMLNAVELRELSLTEADVNREAVKPFWESIRLKGQ